MIGSSRKVWGDMDQRGLWQAVLGELEVSLSRANFATWFRNTAIISHEDGHVVIGVPNIFTKEWLEKKYHKDIRSAFDKVATDISSVEYKVSSGSASSEPATKKVDKEASSASTPSTQASITQANPETYGLNSRYTFDNFVVGSSNELAYAACQAVAKSPGTKYNPLFLYGGVGLGKTHLMQAVGNEILKHDPTKRIAYITSESFTNEFVSSISRKKTESFADKYRKVDVLIIDDMQFLAGKEKTQEEFFHTFNTLHQSNKQIIISSDKPPKAIPTLEERLRSRFEWGMTADIQSPDLETRSAIIQHKATSQGIILPVEVIEYLAANIQQNIRELEGALTQLIAYCELRGITPSVVAAAGILGNIAASRPIIKPITARLIIERAAAYYDLQPADLVGPKRDKEIVVPRQIAMYLMRHELNLSFPKIGDATGGRDHTTAMHSVSKIAKQIEVDESLRSEVSLIKERLLI